MNCLVVGASGYIGSAIAASFEREGHKVLGVGGPFSLKGRSGFSYAEGLYTAIQQDLADVDVVVYAAGRVVPSTSISANEAIRLDALPLGELLESLGRLKSQPAFVFIATAGAIYGSTPDGTVLTEASPPAPVSVYGLVRSLMEQMVEHARRIRQVRGVILRPSNIYGPGQRVNGPAAFIVRALNAAATGVPMELWGTGQQRKDFLFIDDLVDAVSHAVTYARRDSTWDGPSVFNICRGESASLLEVLSLIREVSGKEVPYRTIEARSTDVQRVELSAELAARVLDWHARTDLRAGLAKFWVARSGAGAALSS